ncbi:MAG: Pseudouridine synthase [Parcubacteria group bacterium GW2011_GWC2_39_14]|nr:MAG: Pseudouridine synthase [Parcubacteria group bacterium GW2011_GWC2_39_14]KKR54873.1 MAG: Pseudouridine synthase [Parcubacteria group bacterium GW2011_GWA2_40_23]
MLMRLQKLLANAGIASRRRAEQFILDGYVSVNGKVVTELGTKVDPDEDKILFDKKPVNSTNEKIVLMLNKPPGYVCTTRHFKEEKNVMSLVKAGARVYPVGRLDKDSSGLLILTNDGELADKLMHPRYHKEKEYYVTVNREIPSDFEAAVKTGIRLEDGMTLPALFEQETEKSFYIVLKQGMKRQIRLMCHQFGLRVTSLKRVRINHLELGGLAQGDCKVLTPNEINKLLK